MALAFSGSMRRPDPITKNPKNYVSVALNTHLSISIHIWLSIKS